MLCWLAAGLLAVYYLAPCPTTQPQSLLCSHRLWAVGVPAARGEARRGEANDPAALPYRLTEAESSQPTHCSSSSASPSSSSSSSSPTEYFEGLFV